MVLSPATVGQGLLARGLANKVRSALSALLIKVSVACMVCEFKSKILNKDGKMKSSQLCKIAPAPWLCCGTSTDGGQFVAMLQRKHFLLSIPAQFLA